MLKVILLAVLAVCFVQADDDVIKAFQDAKIVPQLIPKSPPKGMMVEFPSSVDNVAATYGNKLRIADVSALPFTRWELPEDESIKYYSLLAIDLDAANSAAGTGYLLWLNANITGDYQGDDILVYRGPTVKNHRIVIIAFYQKAPIAINRNLARENFNVVDYANRNGLTVLGGNFFYTS